MDNFVAMQCKNCGNNVHSRFKKRGRDYICDCCGSWYRSKETEDVHCETGYALLKSYNFEAAKEVFQNAIAESPDNIDALWGWLLAEYRIIYVKGFYNDIIEPVYCFDQYEMFKTRTIQSEVEYNHILQLLSNDSKIRNSYRKKAEQIDHSIENFKYCKDKTDNDVFICVKISASIEKEKHPLEERTADFEVAEKLYNDLKAKGKKPFFSFYTLQNQIDSDDLIWTNLVKSKKMVLIGSRKDYFDSVWVKSEWKRWLFLERMSDLYILTLPRENQSPFDILPTELSHNQIYTQSTYSKLIKDLCDKKGGAAAAVPDTSQRERKKPNYFLRVALPIFAAAAVGAGIFFSTYHFHEFGEWSVQKAATCEENGEERRICECGEIETREIEALGHTIEILAGKSETCTDDGLTDGEKCNVCQKIITAQEVVPAGHKLEVIPGKAATCTEAGKTDGEKCSVCQEIITAQTAISAKGHKSVTDKGYAATCENSGLTSGSHCEYCNDVLVAQEVIPAKGHTEVDDKMITPTCTETGLTEGSHCSVCNAILMEQQAIPAKGHNKVVDKGYAATCTKEGLSDGSHCSDCGFVIEKPVVLPISHTAVTDKGYAATCTETGLSDGSHCGLCDKILTEQQVIPATGHTEIIDKGYAAGCESEGLSDGKHCDVCKIVLAEQETIAATGHTEAVNKGYAATCEQSGLSDGSYCSVCSKTLVEQETIAALGHTEVKKEGFAPTCTSYGISDGVICGVCQKVLKRQESIAATGHTEVIDAGYSATKTENGLTDGSHCGVCDKILKEQTVIYATGSEGLDYIIAGNVCTITGIGTCSDTELVIPSVINGSKVVNIANQAFNNCDNLVSVFIPDTVKIIGDKAFYSCSELKNVVLMNGITKIGVSAFELCYNLLSIDIPNSVLTIEENAFYKCRNLAKLTMSNNLTSIGNQAFEFCDALKDIVIPDSVTSIGYGAFRCNYLTNITIGSGVIKIEDFAFAEHHNDFVIAYNGTISEWESISIEENCFYSQYSFDYIIYCADGTIDDDGVVTYY